MATVLRRASPLLSSNTIGADCGRSNRQFWGSFDVVCSSLLTMRDAVDRASPRRPLTDSQCSMGLRSRMRIPPAESDPTRRSIDGGRHDVGIALRCVEHRRSGRRGENLGEGRRGCPQAARPDLAWLRANGAYSPVSPSRAPPGVDDGEAEMPSIGAVELVLLIVVVLGLFAALGAVVRGVAHGRSRRSSPPDRMPDAWLEQHAAVEQPTDLSER